LDFQALSQTLPGMQRRASLADLLVQDFGKRLKEGTERKIYPDVFSWFDSVFDIPRAWFHTEILDTIDTSWFLARQVTGKQLALLLLAHTFSVPVR